MSNASVLSTFSMFAVLSSLIESKEATSSLEYLVLAKDHPLYVGVGLLGAAGFLATYRLLKNNLAFRILDGPSARSFFWGYAPEMFNPCNGIQLQYQLMNTYGAVCRVEGQLGRGQLWLADPRALHEILVKGHDDFREPDSFMTWIRLVMGPNVTTTNGHKHKIQRKILNPVFTAKHIRNLVITFHTPTMTTISQHLVDIVTSHAQANGGNSSVVDIYQWMNYVALEIIGQAGMGHSFGVMEDKVPEYLSASRDIFPLMIDMWYIRPFLPLLTKLGPARFRRFVLDRVPHRSAQALKNAADIMDKTAVDIIRHKKDALANGTLDSEVAAGHDIMTTLLRHNQAVAPEDQMSDEEVLAQVNGLIFAGHDTTSSALARTLNLLAQYPGVQTRLRAEVREAHRLYGKNLDYDQLNSLSYLDAICREMLRLYAPATFVERVATKDWTLPLQYPVKSKDGRRMITSVRVTEGTHIYVALAAANRDKQTWGEDADQFRPERWLDSLPETVGEARVPGIYSSIMTFLGGPRACPGMKFSQLEMKIILSNLVSAFKFELTDLEITWKNDAIVKPYVRSRDGTIGDVPSMPMKITVAGNSE